MVAGAHERIVGLARSFATGRVMDHERMIIEVPRCWVYVFSERYERRGLLKVFEGEVEAMQLGIIVNKSVP